MSFDLSNWPLVILAGALALLLVAIGWYATQVAKPPVDGRVGPPTGALAMERKVIAIVGTLVATGLLMAAYGLREPARQAEAQERLVDVSVGRGITLYTSLCFSCHGESGQGAVVPDSNPQRIAPALNRPDMRPPASDADARTKRYDFIYKTIQRGRPGTPMPAWGQSDGGALFDEQMNELTLLIMNGDRTITFEGHTDTAWKVVEDIIKEHVADGVAKLPQQPDIENQDFYKALTPTQQTGAKQFLTTCASCHTIPSVPGATGTIGPILGAHDTTPAVGERKTIAGGAVQNNSVDDLAKWIHDPQALKPGTAMPTLGLSEEQAHNVAEFLYTLK